MEAPQDRRTAMEFSASGPYVRWSFNPQGILDPTREDSRLVISLIMLRLAAIIDEEEQLSRNRGPRKKKAEFSSSSGADVGLSSIGRHSCHCVLPACLSSHIHRLHQPTTSSHIYQSN